jgi:hypothetical protein
MAYDRFSSNNGKVFPVHAMNTYRGVEVWLHSLLLALNGGDRSIHASATLSLLQTDFRPREAYSPLARNK